MMNREMELNVNELDQVNGGRFFCTGIGYTHDKHEASACCYEGASTDEDRQGGIGASACAFYIGIGIGITFE